MQCRITLPALWMAAGTLMDMDSCYQYKHGTFSCFCSETTYLRSNVSFGYSMQSMFIGVASFIAGFLPGLLVNWFGISRDKGAGGIPQNIMWSFYIGAAVFLGAVLYTVFKSKEYPPSDPDWKESLRKEKSAASGGLVKEIFSAVTNMPDQMKRLAVVNFLTGRFIFNVVLLQHRCCS